jgi:hypothetical protein
MKFTVQLDTNPRTGHELVALITRAAKNVTFNIGPEDVRATTGPIYDADKEPMERIGTWTIELGVGSQPRSPLFEQIADICRTGVPREVKL